MPVRSAPELCGRVVAYVSEGEVDERASQSPRLAVAVLAICAGALTLVATRAGPTITPDSTSYLSAAQNLAAGRYSDFTGQALTQFPPALPALLVVGHWLGISGENAARYVNAGSFVGIVLLTWLLARRHARSTPLALAATGFVAFSSRLLQVANKALSETLFILVVLGFLVILENVPSSSRRRGLMLCGAAGALSGAAFLVRYAGITLVVSRIATLAIWWWRERRPGYSRRLAIFAGTATVLPLLWTARNAASGADDLFGRRVAYSQSLTTLARATSRAISILFLPQGASTRLTDLVVASLIVGGAGAVCFSQRDSNQRWPLAPMAVFVLVYIAFVPLSNRAAGSDLTVRIMSPIYVPVVVLAVSYVDRVLVRTRMTTVRTVRRLAVGAVSVCLAILAIAVTHVAWTDGRAQRVEVLSRDESDLARVVGELPDEAFVASNNPFALWYISRHQPIVFSPGAIIPGLNRRPISAASLTQHACTTPTYLAWFGTPDEPSGRRELPTELADKVGFTVLAAVGDGVLYRIEPGSGEC